MFIDFFCFGSLVENQTLILQKKKIAQSVRFIEFTSQRTTIACSVCGRTMSPELLTQIRRERT